MKKYKIIGKTTKLLIKKNISDLNEAIALLLKFESEDKKNGVFTPDFYEIAMYNSVKDKKETKNKKNFRIKNKRRK